MAVHGSCLLVAQTEHLGATLPPVPTMADSSASPVIFTLATYPKSPRVSLCSTSATSLRSSSLFPLLHHSVCYCRHPWSIQRDPLKSEHKTHHHSPARPLPLNSDLLRANSQALTCPIPFLQHHPILQAPSDTAL
jgi:hypothetical protein